MSPDARISFSFHFMAYKLNFHRTGEGVTDFPARMSPKRSLGLQPDSDEETPLLRDSKAQRTETPLPITQVIVLVLLQLCEPIASQSIRPYITQVCSSILTTYFGGDVSLSLSASSRSLVATRERSDTMQG
jgi:hypothetical protein